MSLSVLGVWLAIMGLARCSRRVQRRLTCFSLMECVHQLSTWEFWSYQRCRPRRRAALSAFNVGGQVVQGGGKFKHVSPRILHCRANHRYHEQVSAWHKCSNAPEQWKAKDCACDDCLMSTADKVHSADHAPKVDGPGDLVSWDVFSLGVKHVHGGQIKVLGIHDNFSGFNWVRLLRSETADELIIAWREFLNFAKMHKVTVRRSHTDNAKPHIGDKMTAFMRDEAKIHMTTIVPNEPRQNSVMERQWRSMASDARKSMHHGNMTRNYCWYALDESVAVANTLPIQGNLSKCPHWLFTGKRPNVTQFRVPFCMMYAKVYDPITKMANRSVRCIHLGRCRDQPGYKGLGSHELARCMSVCIAGSLSLSALVCVWPRRDGRRPCQATARCMTIRLRGWLTSRCLARAIHSAG